MKHLTLGTASIVVALSVRLSAADSPDTKSTGTASNAPQKPEFTAQDADVAFAAFNKAFYTVENGKGFYKEQETGGRNHFWTQAEEIEMILDTLERSRSPEAKKLVEESISGFVDNFGTNWTRNKFNDDLLWMTIATARAFLDTGNANYKDLAKFNFDATYARAWSTDLGGGLWWTTNNGSKNACVNGPGAIAACYLSQILGDPSYLDKAKAILSWERAKLFDDATGAVRDNMRADGHIGGRPLTYNEGTFIGAANLLAKLTGEKSYLADAEKAGDYTRDKICNDGILPAYRGDDGPGFNGIFIRWLGKFAGDNNLWPKYHDWMIQNANAAWKNRRADNLSWSRWQTMTPDTTRRAWECADTVVILNLVLVEEP